MSHLDMSAPNPATCTSATATSNDAYCTEHSSLQIPSFIEDPVGKDKYEINRN